MQTDHGSHASHAAAAPPPASLGGALDFSDVSGRAISAADFRGRWTMLFFGYARCRSSCPIAIPKIVQSATRLRAAGVNTRAVFVDIDVAPGADLHFHRPAAARQAELAQHGQHGGHDHGDMNRVAAMRALANTFPGRLTVATGTRRQLTAATAAFRVSREHAPPRDGESGHSLNHSSLIYIIGPDAKVAAYTTHEADGAALVDMVRRLAKGPARAS